MARKRQIKKNLKRYGMKTRSRSKRNARSAAKETSVPVMFPITINPALEINVVGAGPYPVAGAYVPPQKLEVG